MKINQVTMVKIDVPVLKISEEKKIMVDDVVLKNLFTILSSAYQTIKKYFDEKYHTYNTLNNKQVISRAKNTRVKINSNDIFRTIELGSILKLEDANSWFLLFNHSILDPKTDIMERIIGFGNPALFGLLSGKIDLHVNTSFYVVLKPFYQMLVIIAYDP